MQKHTKIYMNHYDFGEQDVILCENCHQKAADIHHLIFKSRGGKDEINSLIALCRNCHTKAHNNKHFNKELQRRKNIEFNK